MGLLASQSPGTELRGKLEENTTSLTVSPHMQWNWRGSTQVITTSLCLQATEFSDSGAVGFLDNHNTLVVAGWQSSVTSNLFLSVSGNYVKAETGGFLSETGSVGPGISMTMFKNRAQTNLQLQFTRTHVPGFGTDRDVAPNIDIRYLVTGRQMLMFRAGVRRFRTADTTGNFDERLATLQYSAAL